MGDTYQPPHYREPLLPLQEIRTETRIPDAENANHYRVKEPECPCFKCPKYEAKHSAKETCSAYRNYLEYGDRKPKGGAKKRLETLKAKQEELRSEYKKYADLRNAQGNQWTPEQSKQSKLVWAKLKYTNEQIEQLGKEG